MGKAVADTVVEHHKVSVQVEHKLDRVAMVCGEKHAQLRVESDGTVFCSAVDDFKWQHKYAQGTVTFDVFWTEWRKFCEAMEALAKAPKEIDTTGESV